MITDDFPLYTRKIVRDQGSQGAAVAAVLFGSAADARLEPPGRPGATDGPANASPAARQAMGTAMSTYRSEESAVSTGAASTVIAASHGYRPGPPQSSRQKPQHGQQAGGQ
jgi:hypothetical protein